MSHQAILTGNLALARALGDFDYKKNTSLSPEAQIITCDPEITEHQITEEDEFLVIACDGSCEYRVFRSILTDFGLIRYLGLPVVTTGG